MTRPTVQDVQRLLTEYQLDDGGHIHIESLGARSARLQLVIGRRHLRPGNTVSGPALMALADVAMYVAVLGEIGLVPLAVTTNLNINFLRKPPPRNILAEAKLLKVGRKLAVGEVYLYSENSDEPVAHVTSTYSIPSSRANDSLAREP